MVFHSFAFYQYLAGKRLTQDLVFDLLSVWQGYLTSSPMCTLRVVLMGECAMSFVCCTGQAADYAVNIVL